jgi:hypothetical protein
VRRGHPPHERLGASSVIHLGMMYVGTAVRDSYIRRRAGDWLAWKALVNPEMIRALGEDACDAIRTAIASIRDAAR